MGRPPTREALNQLMLVKTPGGYPKDLKVYRDSKCHVRIAVPKAQRISLILQEHETLLHVKGPRVLHSLSRNYWWPKMSKLVIDTCAACRQCQLAQIRRKHLAVEFEHSNSMLLPRQQYGIDFYGHANGNILVAIDLCTREVILWFTKSRSQGVVARCLLTGLINQKGVPLCFRSDTAKNSLMK